MFASSAKLYNQLNYLKEILDSRYALMMAVVTKQKPKIPI